MPRGASRQGSGFRGLLLRNLKSRAGQFKATSPDLTLNDGLYRKQYQNGIKLGN